MFRVKFPTYKGLSARFFHKQKSKGCQQRERERDWGEGEQKGRKRKYVHLEGLICMTLQYIYILYHKLNHLGLRLIHVYISPLIYVLEGKYLINTIMKI